MGVNFDISDAWCYHSKIHMYSNPSKPNVTIFGLRAKWARIAVLWMAISQYIIFALGQNRFRISWDNLLIESYDILAECTSPMSAWIDKAFLEDFSFLPLSKFRKVDSGTFTAQNPLESLKSSNESFRPKSKKNSLLRHSYIFFKDACQWSGPSACLNVPYLRNRLAIFAFLAVFWRFLRFWQNSDARARLWSNIFWTFILKK